MESEKIDRKKKLPSIPSNYVTLLQLQERWIKEQERKQKEKEEKEEPQQEQEEKEKQVEERVKDEVAGRESRRNGHFHRHNRENGKRVAEGKPKEAEIEAGLPVNQEQEERKKQVEERVKDEVAGSESRRNGHFRRYNREKGKRVAEGKPKEAEIEAGLPVNQEQEEKEKQVEERVNDEVAGRESRRNAHFRRYNRENGKRVAEGKPKEAEIEAGFAVEESEDVEKKKKGDQVKVGKKNKKWKNKKKDKKKEKAGAEDKQEGVVEPVDPLLPANVENVKREEEVVGEEIHAPKQAIVETTECKPSIITRTEDQTLETGRRFRAMSMKGEIRTGDYNRYRSHDGNFNHRGGNREMNKSHYGKFNRRKEPNLRNEGMVWVKKGEVSEGTVGGVQSSSCSSKELSC